MSNIRVLSFPWKLWFHHMIPFRLINRPIPEASVQKECFGLGFLYRRISIQNKIVTKCSARPHWISSATWWDDFLDAVWCLSLRLLKTISSALKAISHLTGSQWIETKNVDMWPCYIGLKNSFTSVFGTECGFLTHIVQSSICWSNWAYDKSRHKSGFDA